MGTMFETKGSMADDAAKKAGEQGGIFTFPDGLMEICQSFTFLPEEERFGFAMGWVVAVLMED